MIRHAQYARCERCGHSDRADLCADVSSGEFYCRPSRWIWCDERAQFEARLTSMEHAVVLASKFWA